MAEGVVALLIAKLGFALAKEAATLGASLLCKEASALSGLFGEIREAKEELQSMQAYLQGAERFKDTDETTGIFVNKIRGFAFEIEDVVDEFTYKLEDTHGGFAKKMKKRVKHIKAWRRLTLKLQDIKGRLQGADRRKVRYDMRGLETEGLSNVQSRSAGQSLNLAREEDLVGIKETKDKLMHWLVGDLEEPGSKIATIWGMGGVVEVATLRKLKYLYVLTIPSGANERVLTFDGIQVPKGIVFRKTCTFSLHVEDERGGGGRRSPALQSALCSPLTRFYEYLISVERLRLGPDVLDPEEPLDLSTEIQKLAVSYISQSRRQACSDVALLVQKVSMLGMTNEAHTVVQNLTKLDVLTEKLDGFVALADEVASYGAHDDFRPDFAAQIEADAEHRCWGNNLVESEEASGSHNTEKKQQEEGKVHHTLPQKTEKLDDAMK
ncbi:hypothetical protein ZWY2020_031225 [Hordeum vulgare]|nr:hypothetical protein ZWY2020_031225 [Hordeum vulgare]